MCDHSHAKPFGDFNYMGTNSSGANNSNCPPFQIKASQPLQVKVSIFFNSVHTVKDFSGQSQKKGKGKLSDRIFSIGWDIYYYNISLNGSCQINMVIACGPCSNKFKVWKLLNHLLINNR